MLDRFAAGPGEHPLVPVALGALLLVGGCSFEDVDLTGRECPCIDGWVCDPTTSTCRREPMDGGGPADGPEPDAGTVWLLEDRIESDFAQGTTSTTTVIGSGVRLESGANSGSFTSRLFTVPVERATGRSITWIPRAPYGKPLLEEAAGSAELSAYTEGGMNSSGLVLLLRFDDHSGDPLLDGTTVTDSSGHGHTAVTLDLAPPGDSGYRAGRVGDGAFLAREDFLSISGATTHADFAFGTDDFSWMAWVRIDGCAASEDNVIALGGEQPHIWLGAACPSGLAHWQVGDGMSASQGATAPDGIVDDVWHHLVGVKSGSAGRIVLYVDGRRAVEELVDYGAMGNFTKSLLSGNFPIGTAPVYTYASQLTVDELAIFRRALADDEVRSIYLRGALRLRLQVRGCDATGCDAEGFVGPDGTASSFFAEPTGAGPGLPSSQPLPEIVSGSLFQYRATFESDAAGFSPELEVMQLLVGLP